MFLIDNLRGTGLKTRMLRPRDELWDAFLGVHTWGDGPRVGELSDPQWRCEYVPTAYSVLRNTLRRVDLRPDDVFVDLGAGLGRGVFLASWLGARHSVGVDLDGALVAAARRNLARSRLRHRSIEFVEQGADLYPQDRSTIIFMFNPFGAGTMSAVARQIEAGLKTNPRNLRVVYVNPFHASVLDALPCLERLDRWDEGTPPEPPQGLRARLQRAGGWSAAFWRSRP